MEEEVNLNGISEELPTRKLKSTLSFEAQQDLYSQHNIYTDKEFLDIFWFHIAKEVKELE